MVRCMRAVSVGLVVVVCALCALCCRCRVVVVSCLGVGLSGWMVEGRKEGPPSSEKPKAESRFPRAHTAPQPLLPPPKSKSKSKSKSRVRNEAMMRDLPRVGWRGGDEEIDS